MPTELFGVEVDSVGLVRKGANRRPFFLMKGDNTMDQEEVLDTFEELSTLPDDSLDRGAWNRAMDVIKGIVNNMVTPPVIQEEKSEPVVDNTDIKDLKVELASVAKAATTRAEEIEKAYQEKLEKAEQRIEELEKAAEMVGIVPIAKSAQLDAEMLYALKKSNKDAFTALVGALEAKDKQLEEAGLWSEFGSALENGTTDYVQKTLAKAETTGKSLDEVIAEDPDAYARYRKELLERS